MSELAILAVRIPPAVFGAVGSVLAALLLFLALRANRRRRFVDNMPTSKTTGVFIGLVEVKGTAEAETPLRSFLAERSCVQYRYEVEEHWSRTKTETYTDSDGKTRTRTKTESGWKTVASGGEWIPFYLKDDRGVLLVRPDGAEIQGERVFCETVRRGDPLYYGKGPSGSVMDSDHRRRFTEHALPLHHPLYVIGQSRLRDDVVAPEIAQDDQAPMFLISTRSEEQISRGLGIQYWVFTALVFVVLLGGWMLTHHAQGRALQDNIPMYLLLAGGAALACVVGWLWMAYNSLVDLNHRVDQGWSNVDVQLKRRAELIPQLVRVVGGLKSHEKDLQETVARLRNQATATRPGEQGPDPAGVSKTLLALREAYPQLKTSEAFLKLQAEISTTEEKIALARGYYNEIISQHNIRLLRIPDRFVAPLARMTKRAYIEAKDFERPTVKVNLAD